MVGASRALGAMATASKVGTAGPALGASSAGETALAIATPGASSARQPATSRTREARQSAAASALPGDLRRLVGCMSVSLRFPVLAVAALICCALALPSAAGATRQCGSISSSKLTPISQASVFTYKYSSCRRARLIVRAYLRHIDGVMSCQQRASCVRVVRGWKCHVPGVHGTWVGCVPRGTPWEGTNRPFVGVFGA